MDEEKDIEKERMQKITWCTTRHNDKSPIYTEKR
jgi:hypothetical protein